MREDTGNTGVDHGDYDARQHLDRLEHGAAIVSAVSSMRQPASAEAGGFAGLFGPHLARRLAGPQHGLLLYPPACAC